jgi:hypothetical protein
MSGFPHGPFAKQGDVGKVPHRLLFSPRIWGLNPQEIWDAPQEILLICPTLLSPFQENRDIPHFWSYFRIIEKYYNSKHSLPYL